MDWRPIDSAPKDGSEVLATDTWEVRVAKWGSLYMMDRHGKESFGWRVAGSDAGSHWDGVTHWMPLPKPPAA